MESLYRVTNVYACAGLTIKDGKVVDCAPILKMKYWNEREVFAKCKNNNWKIIHLRDYPDE